jgi:hypothetical protein
MTYKIIEDCSPYYIRFTHENIDAIIAQCKDIASSSVYENGFTHQRLDIPVAEGILKLMPMSKQLNFLKLRVSLFVTQPGHYYRAHKDGLSMRIGINYTVNVLDDKCIINWYADDDLKDYPIDNKLYSSREASGFDRHKHTPIKSTKFVEGECILFNTDIFHDVDNTASINQRVLLTLRLAHTENLFFDDVKRILFS